MRRLATIERPDRQDRHRTKDDTIDTSQLIDNGWQRAIWRGVIRSELLIGIGGARRLASLFMRARAKSRQGYTEGVLRVAARHVWSKAPGLQKLPERWWQTDPLVHVQRLGVEIDLDLRDNLQRILYYTGTYEPQVLGLLWRELGTGAVFVDVGAHIGIHSLAVAKRLERVGGRVYAFEPSPDSAGRIRYTAAANALEITVVETALGATAGSVELFKDDRYDEADAGVRSQFGTGGLAGTTGVVRFDDWAAEVGLDRLDAVKIDVEGAEELVIQGMRESLIRLRPRLLIVEAKERSLEQAGGAPARLRAHIKSLGYRRVGVALFGNDVYAAEHVETSFEVTSRSTN